jgi:hypothetical protein
MPDTITLIDSVLVGNSYRKRWYFNDCAPTSVIEGIGAIYGLIEPYAGCIIDQPYFNLTCFKQNGQVLYPDTTTTCDAITVSAGELNKPYKNLNIFPNPVSDELNISFISEMKSELEIHIINVLGQLITTITTGKNYNNENKISIPTDNLQSGIYLIRINTEENYITRKFIKK